MNSRLNFVPFGRTRPIAFSLAQYSRRAGQGPGARRTPAGKRGRDAHDLRPVGRAAGRDMPVHEATLGSGAARGQRYAAAPGAPA